MVCEPLDRAEVLRQVRRLRPDVKLAPGPKMSRFTRPDWRGLHIEHPYRTARRDSEHDGVASASVGPAYPTA